MSTILSIDFDFFIRHGMYEDVEFPDGETYLGELVFDWQMEEGRAPVMDMAIWESRATNFKIHGLDIEEMTKPEISVQDFALELGTRFDLSIPWWRADSHGWAGVVARDYAQSLGPVNVVNFDAHHDLGYGPDVLARHGKTGNFACDDWAVIGMAKGWIRNYTVVYPDWLGRKEWGHRVSRPWLKDFRRKITITTWSEWQSANDEIQDAEAGFLCRSSSWVPPWYDDMFTELAEEFGYHECLDCLYGQHASPYDTCNSREWDWANIDERLEIRKRLLDLTR